MSSAATCSEMRVLPRPPVPTTVTRRDRRTSAASSSSSPSRPMNVVICSGRLFGIRSEEHTSELQSRRDLVCRLLLEKKKKKQKNNHARNIKLEKTNPDHYANFNSVIQRHTRAAILLHPRFRVLDHLYQTS